MKFFSCKKTDQKDIFTKKKTEQDCLLGLKDHYIELHLAVDSILTNVCYCSLDFFITNTPALD